MAIAFIGNQFSEPCEITARGNGEVLIVVSDDQFNKKNLIAVTSSDSGNTWANHQFTSYSGFQEIMQYHSTMVDDSGTVHIVWTYEMNTVDFKILYAQSTDFGQTWSTPVQVSDSSLTLIQTWNYNSEQWPSIVKSANNKLYVTWCDQRADLVAKNYDVFISSSSDNGQTWSTNVKVNDDTTSLYQAQVSVAVRSVFTTDELVVTWIDNRADDIANSLFETHTQLLGARVYPNPVSNELTLSGFKFSVGDEIKIIDVMGKEIYSEKIARQILNMKIETLNFSEGVYFLEIKSGDKKGTARFVKVD